MNQILAKRTDAVTMHSRSHRRLATFVDWIKPESEMREAIQNSMTCPQREFRGWWRQISRALRPCLPWAFPGMMVWSNPTLDPSA